MGNNDYGQASVPAELTGVKAIAAGNGHTVALKEDGTVVAWGYNRYGQTNVPAGLTGVKAIAAAEYITVALKEDGTVVVWGYPPSSMPAALTGVKEIVVDSHGLVALKEDGTVVVVVLDDFYPFWPLNAPVGLSGVKAISAGTLETAALKNDGTIVVWGENGYSVTEVGADNVRNCEFIALGGYRTIAFVHKTPEAFFGDQSPGGGSIVKHFTLRNSGAAALNISSITLEGLNAADFSVVNPEALTVAAGAQSTLDVAFTPGAFGKREATLRLTNNDPFQPRYDISLKGVGVNASVPVITVEQPPDTAFTRRVVSWTTQFPVPIPINYSTPNVPRGVEAQAVAASYGYSATLTSDGKVGVSGNWLSSLFAAGVIPRYYGSYSYKEKPAALDGVSEITLINGLIFAIRVDGSVVGWGNYRAGELNIPAGLNGVQKIGRGLDYLFALKTDGSVVTWGDNRVEQLKVPAGLAGVKEIVTGTAHMVALKTDGTVLAWGDNSVGQLNVPAGLAGVKEITVSGNYTLALKGDGTVVGWGSDPFGAQIVPSGLTGVQKLNTGVGYVIALKDDGTVVAWGDNREGQLNVPAGLAGVKEIHLGIYATGVNILALKSDGTVVAWGSNGDKKLDVPAGLTGVKAIYLGRNTSVALKTDGTVVSWGGTYGIPYGLSEVEAIVLGSNNEMALERTPVRTLAFGSQSITLGHLSRTFTIRNSGPVPLHPGKVTLMGENAADFSVDTTGMLASVAPGAETTFTVRFTPGALGLRVATLQVASDDPVTPSYDFVLNAAGIDLTPPIIVPQADLSMAATTSEGAIVIYPPADGTLVYSPASGSRFPIGKTVVTVTAIGNTGNTAYSSFTVTVTPDQGVPEFTMEYPSVDSVAKSGVLPLSGIARDNHGITRVEVVINGGAPLFWTPVSAAAPDKWSLSVMLEPGLNTVVATAYNIFNTPSIPITRTFRFSRSQVEFAGRYSGRFNAIEGSPGGITHEGMVSLVVLPTGAFSGKVTFGGTVFPIAGVFFNDRTAYFGANSLPFLELRKKGEILPIGKLALSLDSTSDAGRIKGTLTQGDMVLSSLEYVDRAPYSAKSLPVLPNIHVPISILNRATDNGRYTALLLAGEAPDAFPLGTGWAKINVMPSGTVRMVGRLADGVVISYSGLLSKKNELPLFIPLYKSKGLLAGTLAFDPEQEASDAGANGMRWYKPANPSDRLYPAGWPEGISVNMVASKFVQPSAGSVSNALGLAGVEAPAVNAISTLLEGSAASNNLAISSSGKVTVLSTNNEGNGAQELRLFINPVTGAVSGSFKHPVSGKAVGISGLVYQKTHSAGGYFLYFPTKSSSSAAASGEFSIRPKP